MGVILTSYKSWDDPPSTILPQYLGKTLCLVFVADFPPLLTEEIPVISGRCCYKSLMQDDAYWSWHSLNLLNLILSRWCMNSDFHSVESPLFSLEKQELRIEKNNSHFAPRIFLFGKEWADTPWHGKYLPSFLVHVQSSFSRTSCRYFIHSARECWFRWLWSDLVAIAQGPSARKTTDFWLVRSCLRAWGNEFLIIINVWSLSSFPHSLQNGQSTMILAAKKVH